ncbi:hypothetical protein TVAG_168150 [Trichomonas vaginalis G3]|uniref:Uncharacterized protein n=1 Tax=Trichomonas vaginalis (strain ATCC PRA-98 / G3) TaxID=412133 RepID=A2FBI3_TRIV3|nr:armadillo (ARM) repeat-containing protein family [Trichomonas vaginalis G3]EAX97718.1 hypothetical protein TVAG_168150 [Trichomonas vaginalis G3]KAI5546011.1 armadillo (ARM) repeat-containing protein family [Trichomonas vaginalis G3]|eukprot:XP_001310648.1 hypothetical protein [Trichomonas vaginalis G3]
MEDNDPQDDIKYKKEKNKHNTDADISTLNEVDIDNKPIDENYLSDLSTYLEMSKGDNETEITDAISWINKMFPHIFTECPIEFILALIGFCKSNFEPLKTESFDLLIRFLHSKRSEEIIEPLINSNIIEMIIPNFPSNQAVEILGPLSRNPIGKKIMMETNLLSALNDVFTDGLEAESAGLIAQFIANLTMDQFTYLDQIPIVCQLMLKFKPYIKPEIDAIIASNITRAFCNFVHSNHEFCQFFKDNFDIKMFYIYNGNPSEADDDSNEDMLTAKYGSISDVIVMINDLIEDEEEYCDYVLQNNLLEYIDDVFNYEDNYLNSVITELLTEILGIFPQIFKAYHDLSYDYKLTSVLVDEEISVQWRIAILTFIAVFIISGIDVDRDTFVEIQNSLPDGGFFTALSRNIEIVTDTDLYEPILDAFLCINEFERSEEIEEILMEMSENSDLRDWLENIENTHHIKNIAKAHILEDLLDSMLEYD